MPYWPASALYGSGRDWHGHISSELVSVCSFNNVRPDAGCDHSIPLAEDLDHGQKLYCIVWCCIVLYWMVLLYYVVLLYYIIVLYCMIVLYYCMSVSWFDCIKLLLYYCIIVVLYYCMIVLLYYYIIVCY